MKLFRVYSRGGKEAFVVANSADRAYSIFRALLDNLSIGFSRERQMDTISLIAEEGEFPDCSLLMIDPPETLECQEESPSRTVTVSDMDSSENY